MAEKIEVTSGVPYGTGGSRELLLDLYRPSDDRDWGRRSGWVFIHGGGWRNGSRDVFSRQATHLAQTLGAVCVSIDYRLSGEAPFPAALEDAKCAVRWLRAN